MMGKTRPKRTTSGYTLMVYWALLHLMFLLWDAQVVVSMHFYTTMA